MRGLPAPSSGAGRAGPQARRSNQAFGGGGSSSSSNGAGSPTGSRPHHHSQQRGSHPSSTTVPQAMPALAAAAAMMNPIYGGSPEEDLPKVRPLWPARDNGTPQQLDWQRERERERGDREKKPKLVKVRLSVHYRVHSRQMLCIGGSQIPFGWSFLSIAKVPMTWLQGDVWQAEVMLPAGQRIEYKYVILEEQDWTKLENEDAEGLVEVTYRSGTEPGKPPDVQVIQKQMAIVAWQPGPNRIVQVPTEEELGALAPGERVERVPARPPARSAFEPPPQPDPFAGTREALTVTPEGEPILERRDVWGWTPPASGRPQSLRNLRFDN